MTEKVNVLLVDDQPDKLLAYEVILQDLGENLVKTSSARDALQFLLKNDVAVVLVDVCMPVLDGFQFAAMLREHPRFRKTAIIFISAILLTDVDRLRGYEMGAADYVPVPVVPEVLRAKVRVFVELFRKTRELEELNSQLERHVTERTVELESSNQRLLQSEQGRSLALAAGQMGSWDWDLVNDDWKWDEGQCRIFGVDHATFRPSPQNVGTMVEPEDMRRLTEMVSDFGRGDSQGYQTEFRVVRLDGTVRWCFGTAAPTVDASGKVVRISGVTIDITDRKETEERQAFLSREVDHRARNALAVIQSIIRLTRAKSVDDYVLAIEGRIKAMARAHTLLSDSRWHGADLGALVAEELAPYRAGDKIEICGPDISLQPATAQGLALALHELATNAAKHGALSLATGKVRLDWRLQADTLNLHWVENGGPHIESPSASSFGLKVIVASVEQQLGGKVEFDWGSKGLQCVLSIPRSVLLKTRVAGERVNGEANGVAAGLNPAGKPRVLLVEDEALVAMMIQESLTEFGFHVIGPVCTVSEAEAVARDDRPDVAVLDINLGDGMIYSVAEILAVRGVPFVFVTGYDAESVDSRFSEIPILQKPIDREILQRIFAQHAERYAAH